MDRNSTCPVVSTGVWPVQCCRFSSIGCGKRDKLFTHSATSLRPSSSSSRTYVSTDGLDPPSSRNVPVANASWRRRTASMVRVQLSSDDELSTCASTFTDWYPYIGSWFGG